MEFARRGQATSAADVFDDVRRFPDPPSPPPHGDSMQVIRDALLSQLQKDRLRQEIIVAELAKIERAMALRSAAADTERAKPAPFDLVEQFMTYGARTGGPEGHVSVGKANDRKKEDGVRRRKGKRSKERHVTEDGLVSESWKTSSSTFEPAGEQKNSTRDDEGKPQESCEAKKSPSMKWRCAICHVEATSAGNLLQHFSGQKHRDNVNALKARAEAEKARKATQGEEKPCPPWTCRFCQVNCTGKSDSENHLKGKKHYAKIQALLEECKSMARDSASESDSHQSILSEDEEEPDSVSICGICQVKWSCRSVMEDHVGGKKHRKNFQALQLEAKRLGTVHPKMAGKKQAPQEWNCSTCQVRCNSESQFQDHCRSMEHMKTVQKALYFCKLCGLQCNSAKMLAHHQAGRKHQAKLGGC